MDLTSVPGWLLGILPAAITAIIGGVIGAYIGPRFQTKFQERARARREHLDDVKERVFRPLCEELEDFYLPLLHRRLGPVVTEYFLMPVEGSITQSLIAPGSRLAQRRVRNGEQILWIRPPEPAHSPELYEDAKRRHWRELLCHLEAFKARVETYMAAWKAYAEDLSRAIAARAGLPVIEAPGGADAVWVRSIGLAIFVVERQLGVNTDPLFIGFESDKHVLRTSGQRFAQAQTEEAIGHLRDILDELAMDRRKAEELHRPAEALRHEAAELLREFKLLRHSQKLPGRCPLVKV